MTEILHLRDARGETRYYVLGKGDESYIVFDSGQVISNQPWRGKAGRELRQDLNEHGYPSVRLTLDGKRRRYLVHRLMEPFMPTRPTPQHETRHLNGDPTDNDIDNLAWGTRKDNAADREKHGRTARGERNGSSKLTTREVREIKAELGRGISTRKLGERYGVDRDLIWQIKTGKVWAHVVD